MERISLVMPMAGFGSRFSRAGEILPKPLIEINGRPFFYWATESVRGAADVHEMVFVVLADHIEQFAVDRAITSFYPEARLIIIDRPTSGAAETASLGIEALSKSGPVAVNDCDHAFAADFGSLIRSLQSRHEGALVGFRSSCASYSYVRFDDHNNVVGTVEKQSASPYAIAGCYLFASPETFTQRYQAYRRNCPYDELFLSGIYNEILGAGGSVGFAALAAHVSFGTPSEFAHAKRVTWPIQRAVGG